MISKFSKMHNSIFTKVVLSITALSFMSLFGVSGYINTANSNKAVIKVNDSEFSQSEFNYLLQTELARYKAASGDDLSENQEIRNQLIVALAKSKLDDLLLEEAMRDFNVDVTDKLVGEVIRMSPQFQHEGRFDRETYKWYLNRSGMTEKELIAQIKRNIARQVLLDAQVAGSKVPHVLQQQMEKVLGQRRNFSYVKLVNAQTKVDRQPSEEEIKQYYEDFSEEFTVPEKRDINLMYLSMADIEKNIEVTDEEVAAYYKEHSENYETPEQRNVLQLAFDTREQAEDAAAELAKGTDFMAVAAQNGLKAEEVELGFVANTDLSEELAEVVFNLSAGQTSQPQEIGGDWQILRVTEVKAAHKTDKAQAYAEITAELKQQSAYDRAYELINEIEDKIGGGTSLAELAQGYKVPLIEVKAVAEDGTVDTTNSEVKELFENQDLRDAVFSYNEGETSQAVETDNGIAVIEVSKIKEAHVQNQDEIADKIKKMWFENEQSSITLETIDNISHDLEAGDTLKDVAGRYGLHIVKTMPITRGENFDNLTYNEMKELFSAPREEPQIIKVGEDYVIAQTNDIYDDSASLSEEEKSYLAQTLALEINQEMSEALLKGFTKDYKIEVNYNRMGLSD